jgi:hypothetical protein
MNVSYLAPLQRAWARSRRMLLRPFDLGTWVVLGFAAFISEFGARGGYQTHYRGPHGHVPWHGGHGLEGIVSGAVRAGIGVIFVVVAVLLVVLLTWINSRGRFVFLDDVANERAAIVEPWKRHAALGNSLFLWTLGLEAVCAGAIALMALPFVAVVSRMWSEGQFHWEMLGALWVLLAMVLPFALAVALTLLALSDFVVPIMYRQRIGVLAAWSRFLALFRAQPGAFVLYALFVFLLSCVITSALFAVGLMTCCVGFVLFSLPYVSSVVLLPIHVTFRALGPEFLAQFGSDYAALAAPAAPSIPGPGGGGGR